MHIYIPILCIPTFFLGRRKNIVYLSTSILEEEDMIVGEICDSSDHNDLNILQEMELKLI